LAGALLFSCIAASPAADAGPAASVAAIRNDVPVLFSTDAFYAHGAFTIDRVVTDGSAGVAFWQTNFDAGVAILRRRSGVWWLVAYSKHPPGENEWTEPRQGPAGPCVVEPERTPGGPSAQVLIDRYGFAPSLAQSAVEAYAVPPPVPIPIASTSGTGTLLKPSMHIDCTAVPSVGAEAGGYYVSLSRKQPWDESAKASITAENTGSPSDATVKGMVHVAIKSPVSLDDAVLDVWCPFVIDPKHDYWLSIVTPGGYGVLTKATIEGNALRFDLPPMKFPPGTAATGTVSSTPPVKLHG
jgi:hypothetical protein